MDFSDWLLMPSWPFSIHAPIIALDGRLRAPSGRRLPRGPVGGGGPSYRKDVLK